MEILRPPPLWKIPQHKWYFLLKPSLIHPKISVGLFLFTVLYIPPKDGENMLVGFQSKPEILLDSIFCKGKWIASKNHNTVA